MSELAVASNRQWDNADRAFVSGSTHHDATGEDIAESYDEFDNRFRIRVADQAGWRSRASSLIERRYAWRGYSTSPLEGHTSGQVTLCASVDDATVATITAGARFADRPLRQPALSRSCAAAAGEGRKLCEFTKLAVDESVRSQAVLGAIFHVACIYVINLHRCTDVLIEVNPRHVRFYERMLGFRRVGEERLDPVVNAPAVLLRLDLAHCAAEIARLGGQRSGRGRERSFYPYFFAPRDAESIVGRLRIH